jgi:hypothetical protein
MQEVWGAGSIGGGVRGARHAGGARGTEAQKAEVAQEVVVQVAEEAKKKVRTHWGWVAA